MRNELKHFYPICLSLAVIATQISSHAGFLEGVRWGCRSNIDQEYQSDISQKTDLGSYRT